MSSPSEALPRGDVPESWSIARLDDVTEIAPLVAVEDLADHQLVHFVPMAAVAEDFGGIDTTQLRPLREVRRGYTAFKAGDVLLAKITPCMENGKGGLVPKLAHSVAYGSTEFHVLRASAAIADSWLAQYLSQPAFRSIARANMTGTAGQMRVPTKWLRAVEVPIPPRTEQSRIVEKLEELLSDLDAGVAELKAAQKKLAQYRQSLLKAAVEGALTAEWRKKHKPTETGAQLLERILTERRARWEAMQLAKVKEQGMTPAKDWQKKYPDPAQPKTTNLPELPDGWAWARVDQTGLVQLGRQRAPQFHTGANMVPYLRVANVFEERIDVSDVKEMHFSEEDEATFKLTPGDVLLNEGQSLELIGRPAIFRGELPRACFTNTLVRFRAESGVIAEYALAVFLHYMHSGRFRKIAKITTNIAHLGAGRFAELEFPLPPAKEQAEIIRLLQTSMDEVDRQRAAIAHALKQSAAQRQNILRAAFTGRLVPQDPKDEPASKLLERIRAERAGQVAVKTPRARRTKEAA